MSQIFSSRVFELLGELKEHNTREWYHEHKAEFEGQVRIPFASLLEELTERLASTDLPLGGNKKTMFRQNRDIRFSKDKSPYQTHVSGILTPSGRKDESEGVLYLHIHTEGGFLACGFYKLPTDRLRVIRDSILEKPDEFQAIIDQLNKKNLPLVEDGKLTAMPKGYKEFADHPMADFLKLKSFSTHKTLDKQELLEEGLVEEIIHFGLASKDLLAFCQQ
ncbi:MAG: DUF2461 domain-containing protein [Bacteroidota bacterium]